jgi:light-regulated signal transduction histidine kinase (bacteriophytochrome)
MELEEQALLRCEQEPIHTPGAIQNAGVLVLCDADFSRVTHISGNAREHFKVDAEELLGQSVTWLGRPLVHDVRGQLATMTPYKRREYLGVYETQHGLFYASLHMTPEHPVLELEPATHMSSHLSPLLRVRSMLGRLQESQDIQALFEAAVRVLRAATNCERVMAYRFLPSGDGEVFAEARRKKLPPYLGLRYPASDIPQRARDLYLKAPMRIIYDTRVEPVPLLSLPEYSARLDMSLCYLRAVSPVHIQYLKNMGVRGTMSLPIIIDGKLWGLFSCHNTSYRMLLLPDTRATCEMFGEMFSLILRQYLDQEQLQAKGRVQQARLILEKKNVLQDLDRFLEEIQPVLHELLPGQGMALRKGDQWHVRGVCPPTEALKALEEIAPGGGVTSQEELSQQHPEQDWGRIAGLLRLHIMQDPDVDLFFFREHLEQQLRWGGDPRKNIVHDQDGPRLEPRGSFQEYIELVRGRCEPWTSQEILIAKEIRTLLLEQMARKEWIANRRQQVLVAELNHRIKNIFTLLRSLARQTLRPDLALADYAEALDKRIVALATAHDLATGYNARGASLLQLLEAEVGPHKQQGTIVLDGDPITLRPEVAPMLALLFHELATNAVKYGALSTSTGQLHITWEMRGEELRVTWKEQGGPAVAPPSNKGFGLVLIERAVPYEFGGRAKVDFLPEGLKVTFDLPASNLQAQANKPTLALSGSLGAPIRAMDISHLRLLVVEDNMLLAMDTEELLYSFGAEDVDLAASVQLAHSLLEEKTYDLALLDINLGGLTSYDLARRLRDLGVPFLFMTGYGSRFNLPEDLKGSVLLSKPVDTSALRQSIQTILEQP